VHRHGKCPEHEKIVEVRRNLYQGEELWKAEVLREPYVFNWSAVHDALRFRRVDDTCVEEVFEMHLMDVSFSCFSGKPDAMMANGRIPVSHILDLQVVASP
jgi:hypothetical protein